MPELPEVENVRRNLESMVVGRTIASVDVRLPRIIRTPDDTVRFAAELAGCTIQSVSRRGKYLLFSVPPYTLVSHLRMEGQYLWVAADEPVAPHTHVIFHFDDHTELRYRDVRQFGTMDLIEPGQPLPKGLLALGPEPFSEDLDHDGLYRRVHRRTASIKAVLLDQAVLAGLGNIYVDEALFRAGIHPARPAHQLTRAEAQTLVKAIREVLTEAIEAGEAPFARTWTDTEGMADFRFG
ncbi:formamidopyrimidine-DNA glycosylase [Alicyclobacillus contaminans]|nr:formamidopyrimidine-DNA glycosylase [Alicyclobacillus contaminans]